MKGGAVKEEAWTGGGSSNSSSRDSREMGNIR